MCSLLSVFVVSFAAVLGFAAVPVTAEGVSEGPAPPNVLLIVADDLGVDLVGAYGEHPDPGHTPVIDGLAASGVLFRNAWANPLCSPTRAALLTGRHVFRTGVGEALEYATEAMHLESGEVSLPDAVSSVYTSALAGKWHLSSRVGPALDHPAQMGWLHHRGTIENIPGFVGPGYMSFLKTVDGVEQLVLNYATTETVDDALALAERLPEPWMLWVTFNAPHSPFHKPPRELHTFVLPGLPEDDIPLHTKAAVEAMDTELGRLLDELDPAVRANTLVVFLGDNGTDARATTAPFVAEHAKKTIYEGGVNVPLIVSGPGVVAGGECAALVGVTDLAATVAELAGVSMPSAIDSVSFLPYLADPGLPSIRDWVYSEYFTPNGQGQPLLWHRTVREARYKLVWQSDVRVQPPVETALYDLLADPFESTDLLQAPLSAEAQAAHDELVAVLAGLVPSLETTWTNLGYGLEGSDGTPYLTGQGSLAPHTPFGLTLTHAEPLALAALIIGGKGSYTPFFGSWLVPFPDDILFVGTDAGGGLSGQAIWPSGLPSDLSVLFQFWIFDPAALFGVSASNAVAGTTP